MDVSDKVSLASVLHVPEPASDRIVLRVQRLKTAQLSLTVSPNERHLWH